MGKIFSLILCSTVFVGLIGCAKKTENAPVVETAKSYQGAGSKWSASIQSSSFTLTRYASAAAGAAVEVTISGTVATNSVSLFKVLTVTSSSGTGAPAVGSTSTALEIPDTAFFFTPFASAGEPIVLISAGACPTSGYEANWIIAKPRSDFTPPLTTSSDFFGSVNITFNGASSSLVTTGYQPITGASVGQGGNLPFNSANCADGIVRIADGADFFDLYFTTGGMTIVKFSPSTGNQIIFGSPKQSAAVTQAAMAGVYSGIAFEDKAAGDSIFPVELTIPASGSSTGFAITNVTNNTVDTNGIAISNIASTVDSSTTELPTGFFRGDLNPASGLASNGKISCAFSTAGAVKLLSCSGYMNNTGTDAAKPFFFLARSR